MASNPIRLADIQKAVQVQMMVCRPAAAVSGFSVMTAVAEADVLTELCCGLLAMVRGCRRALQALEQERFPASIR